MWQSPGVGIEVNQAESMVFCPGGGGCNPRVNLVREDAVLLSQGGAEISLPIAKDGLKVLGGAVGSESFCSEVFRRNVAKIVHTWNLWTRFTFGASWRCTFATQGSRIS